MGKISKTFALFLTLTIAMSLLTLLTVMPTNAQSVTKLPVPEFTVKYTDHSYDAPATTNIDQYTGQSIENPAHHVVNRSITFTIQNQAVNWGFLHFVIAMKGHFSSSNWTNIYDAQVTDNSTLILWSFSTSDLSDREVDRLYHGGDSFYLPYTGEVDFMIKAQTWGEVMATRSPQNIFGGSITTLFGESDWSNVLTLTLTDGATSGSINTSSTPTPSQSSTPSPTIPELSWLAILPLLLSVFSIAVIVRHRKTSPACLRI